MAAIAVTATTTATADHLMSRSPVTVPSRRLAALHLPRSRPERLPRTSSIETPRLPRRWPNRASGWPTRATAGTPALGCYRPPRNILYGCADQQRATDVDWLSADQPRGERGRDGQLSVRRVLRRPARPVSPPRGQLVGAEFFRTVTCDDHGPSQLDDLGR